MSPARRSQYQRNLIVAMAIYTALVIATLPWARSASDPLWKALLALTPVAPLVYVVVLMAQRIRRSDELEQRTHLVGLGVAAAVVSVASLVGGFLAVANALPADAAATTLVWIFPLMMFCYGLAQLWTARRYGVDTFCDDDNEGFPRHLRLFAIALILGAGAAWMYSRYADVFRVGLVAGIAFGFAVAGTILGLRHRVRRHRGVDGE